MRTSHVGPRRASPAFDLLDTDAISLAQVLSMVEEVAAQFRHSAPSKASATLVQSALWLVAAKLEALQSLRRQAPRTPTDHPPAAARVTGHAPSPDDEIATAAQPDRDAGSVSDFTEPSAHDPHRSRSEWPTRAGLPEQAPTFVSTHLEPSAPQDAAAAPAVPLAEAPERTTQGCVNEAARTAARMVIDDHSRPGPPATGDARARPVADEAPTPPDEYDGLCAVGARLFAAAAVTA